MRRYDAGMQDFYRPSSAPGSTHIMAELSKYAESLRQYPALSEACAAPVRARADVVERIATLAGVVHQTSRHLRDDECDAAKHALRTFVVALDRLPEDA